MYRRHYCDDFGTAFNWTRSFIVQVICGNVEIYTVSWGEGRGTFNCGAKPDYFEEALGCEDEMGGSKLEGCTG